MGKPSVFISYSHKDKEWKDLLVTQLGVLERESILGKWDDGHIETGEEWYKAIYDAMGQASLAVMLISADFLTSRFILEEEVPFLMRRKEAGELTVFPIFIRHCAYDEVEWLSPLQVCTEGGKPLCDLPDNNKKEECLTAIAKEIKAALDSAPPKPAKVSPPRVSLGKLPQTSHDLFGRVEALSMLDEAWEDPEANVLCLVAWGGIGKTSLVNKWLMQMGAEDFRGAERVFGWSFYSQGTSESKEASADGFIAEALGQFGDDDPTAGSPWDKGERLAQLIREQKTLLILDGVEPLQYLPGGMKGRVKDAALEALLKELVYQNPGLCIVTTRWELGGLMARQTELIHLSPEAGAQFLSRFEVKGTPDELKQASVEFGGHALALTLLGSLLVDSEEYDGDIRCRREIPPLEWAIDEGGHARRVMESYERYLGESPELSILHLMGLFDRPAEKGALAVLRKAPVIPGLTDRLFTSEGKPLSQGDWDRAIAKLRRARLLLDRDPDNPGALDAHPLVRQHFGEKLEKSNPDAYREAHSRLYEYYKSVPEKELPGTLDEMLPLYAAVAHGCQAGRHQEAYDEVYGTRILRGDEYYSVKKLGAFGADLAAISGFFDSPWLKPVDGLTEGNKAVILNAAGSWLQALGRLAEAAEPMQASLETLKVQEYWRGAAQVARNLSELHLTMGEVKKAVDYARQSVDCADRSDDADMRVAMRATLADALHQAGKLAEAKAVFIQAEVMQKKYWPAYLFLCYYLGSFRYCDLLLGQGEYREVLNRAGQTLEWAEQASLDILSAALDHLSLGRAHTLQAQEKTGDFSQACIQLDQAVDGLRQAGTQHNLPWGLLARAELHRVMGNTDRAQHDLDEVMTIAERGGMRLHEADCHLGFARLHLAMGDKGKARESLETAREMIKEMGYHRRDKEVKELEKQF